MITVDLRSGDLPLISATIDQGSPTAMIQSAGVWLRARSLGMVRARRHDRIHRLVSSATESAARLIHSVTRR